MLSPEIRQRKSLFLFLHNIDVDLAEGVRLNKCPFVGDFSIMQPISASLAEVPLILMRPVQPG
jgi:hypothetical protein